MAVATELVYTEKELEAIKALEANRGQKLSSKELGVQPAVLTSLIKKANDERPMADGSSKVVVYKEDVEDICPTCGAKHAYKVFWIN